MCVCVCVCEYTDINIIESILLSTLSVGAHVCVRVRVCVFVSIISQFRNFYYTSCVTFKFL